MRQEPIDEQIKTSISFLQHFIDHVLYLICVTEWFHQQTEYRSEGKKSMENKDNFGKNLVFFNQKCT